ncbi:hypothetical protein LIER_31470 [Lithospermum erythrorhizon]|uniref:Uncharacterized protein n=1 Tax=Lithospermum erythrorhizon TaxID=34254 RepID=A0AAV3RUW0_LITER
MDSGVREVLSRVEGVLIISSVAGMAGRGGCPATLPGGFRVSTQQRPYLEEENVQRPVYYVNWVMRGAETRYPFTETQTILRGTSGGSHSGSTSATDIGEAKPLWIDSQVGYRAG